MSSCGLMSEAEKSQKNGRIIQKAPKTMITYLIISRTILITFSYSYPLIPPRLKSHSMNRVKPKITQNSRNAPAEALPILSD